MTEYIYYVETKGIDTYVTCSLYRAKNRAEGLLYYLNLDSTIYKKHCVTGIRGEVIG
jgi:hypothetical protein